MWSFSLFEEEDLINFLQRGMLDEEIDELIKQWEYLTPAVQFQLIKHLRSLGFDEEKLAKALGIKKATAKALLENQAIEFEFPAVSEKDGMLVRGLAVLDTPENFCNIREHKRHITPVAEYLRSKGVLSDGFGVVFDNFFVGNSFQLSMTLPFLVKKMPPDLCWSGAVRKDGRLVKVDSLDKKSQVCQKFGKRLAQPFHLQEITQLVEWLNATLIDIPIVISKEPIRLEEFFEKKENLLNLWHIHRIEPNNLIIQTGNIQGKAWQEVAERFSKLVKELDYTLERRLKAHIVINGPASLSFAFGILYSHTRPSVIYHFERSEKKYYPIELLNTREVKEAVKDYKFVNYSLEGEGENLAVVLFFGHHNPVASVKTFLSNQGLSSEVLILNTEESRGNIHPANYKQIAKECASIVQEIKGKKHYKEFHFFFSCPVALAYLFGVAYGHYDKGCIYNYNDGSYECVLRLEFLRGLIEGS